MSSCDAGGPTRRPVETQPSVPGHRPYGDAIVGVVGVGLVDRLTHPTRLLAARRAGPGRLSGGWELPGGKVEDGESWQDAARRELWEELGVDVRLGRFVAGPARGGLWPLGERYVMGVWLAEVRDGVPTPRDDHDQVRWLAPEELYDVPWLTGDLPVVRAVAPLLGR